MSLIEVLEGLTFTAPYSLDDARELFAMIHKLAPGSIADVHSPLGTKVFVEIRTERGTLQRAYDVV